ncbi:TenA family transcriptional regulator [Phormidium tenue]|uniref:Aminopyrimidine aminohydrolase n=1 Tax=Phormidium tenue NIES-30 TaxID=549789 RepID=A0A1U7JAG5_9CYAN|nr:TenA family transcriptional regulator [Phormidium tenue]MBD2230435.1 TenA family transcriptional regulator [Phormidium tenue FACHB-1052]OKH50774.1 TenA family transcriptional regulator [Phormidium tenue NIES-30]
MPLTCQSLLQAHPAPWDSATTHPFLAGCQSGTLHPAQFNTWLVQDFLFVKDFTRMVGRVLGAAPDDHIDGLLAGLGALKDELLWFEAKAAERSLNLSTSPQLTCQRYCEFMASLAARPYSVQATALWAIEYAYNQGWQLPGPMPEPYTEFADRWGNPGFTDYVHLLAAQADAALAIASPEVQAQAEAAFLQVADLEANFWQMAFTAAEAAQ